MTQIIETTSNQLYRVVSEFSAEQFDCVEVKRVRGGFVDKAKARSTIINKRFIYRVVA